MMVDGEQILLDRYILCLSENLLSFGLWQSQKKYPVFFS